MNNDFIPKDVQAIHQRAKQLFLQEDYSQAACLYEQLIQFDPGEKPYYWHLGLIFLLQGQELEAQTTWFMGLSEGDLEQVGCWTENLVDILTVEAERRTKNSDYQSAWLIRQHINELVPDSFINILQIIQLSIKLECFLEEELFIRQATDLIRSRKITEAQIEFTVVAQVIQQLLRSYSAYEFVVDLIESIIFSFPSLNISRILFEEINQIQSNHFVSQELVIRFVKLCLYFSPDNLSVLKSLVTLQQDACEYSESIKNAENLFNASEALIDKITARYLILRGLMLSGGEWQKSQSAYKLLQDLTQSLVASNEKLTLGQAVHLIATTGTAPYFKDAPKQHHQFRNHIARLCQLNIAHFSPANSDFKKENCLLRIGYISTCFRRHSVTWLSRWLLTYHDSEAFQFYAYSLKYSDDDLQQFVASKVSKFSDLSLLDTSNEIADYIRQDKIDILIDLDSITSQKVSNVMFLKPAPVQVTWLGSDASGVPTVDYFIADNHVLPESAQDYYTSKIWRLPHTYLAVDGFEVGVPTLHRNQLDISDDAVIFFSSQTGYKRHPDTVRLQMQILKEVPGSYFLVRGLADENSVKCFFEDIAEKEGVSCDRLRFLPVVASEEIHRANLAIADVVLDTYPYNGATTTLETLWMGIPLVTRVGEQFAARNSYTFMKNAGITEGIAWTDQEYVDWGVRLGQDEALRQQVAWKLQQSRKTSPLWNAKQFTREMENAYRSMWALYLEQQ